MKDSLLNLQRGIGLREYSAESEEKSRYHWYTSRRPRACVQYGSCSVWEAACRQLGDTQGRQDLQRDGPGGTERQSPPAGPQEVTLPQAFTGALVDGVRHAPLFFTWRTTIFFLSFISSCILLSRSSSREEGRKVVHAFRAIAPPQSVLMWYSCCSCLKLKEGANDRLRSLDCSKHFLP